MTKLMRFLSMTGKFKDKYRKDMGFKLIDGNWETKTLVLGNQLGEIWKVIKLG